MSEIKVDTLTGKTIAGNITITSTGGAATFTLNNCLPACWARINHDIATISDSVGVSSFTDTTTGQGQVFFTNNMVSSTSYATAVDSQNELANNDVCNYTLAEATASYQYYTIENNGFRDKGNVSTFVIGEIA
jgi:hypothetical protein